MIIRNHGAQNAVVVIQGGVGAVKTRPFSLTFLANVPIYKIACVDALFKQAVLDCQRDRIDFLLNGSIGIGTLA